MVVALLDTSNSVAMMSRLTREKVCQGCGGSKEEPQWDLGGDSLTFLTAADNVNVILKNHSRKYGREIMLYPECPECEHANGWGATSKSGATSTI